MLMYLLCLCRADAQWWRHHPTRRRSCHAYAQEHSLDEACTCHQCLIRNKHSDVTNHDSIQTSSCLIFANGHHQLEQQQNTKFNAKSIAIWFWVQVQYVIAYLLCHRIQSQNMYHPRNRQCQRHRVDRQYSWRSYVDRLTSPVREWQDRNRCTVGRHTRHFDSNHAVAVEQTHGHFTKILEHSNVKNLFQQVLGAYDMDSLHLHSLFVSLVNNQILLPGAHTQHARPGTVKTWRNYERHKWRQVRMVWTLS